MTTEEGDARGPFSRAAAWWRIHVAAADAVLAGAVWLLTAALYLVSATGLPVRAAEMTALVLVASLQTLPLAWRRTRPDLSFALIVAAHVLQLVVTDSPMPTNVSALISVYAVAAYSRHVTVRRAALGVAVASGVLASIDWRGLNPSGWSTLVMSSVFYSVMVLVFWLWGDLHRRRRMLVSRLREQNDALRRDQDQRAALAAQDERARIARDMHDIVAHSLSVVVVQADGAAYTAARSEHPDRDHIHQALTVIGATAREALRDTRQLVGVLRTSGEGDDAPVVRAPTEGLADVRDLIERVRASGVTVTLHEPTHTSTETSDVPRESGLAAYRIVQESLTNVLKHAGPGAQVRVRIDISEDHLAVEVCDDGRGSSAVDDGRGHGLIGMRERAASVGGVMTAGPLPGGGYRVHADLPLDPKARP